MDMKLGPVTKLDKRNKTIPKKIMMTSYQKSVTSWSFFQPLAKLEQSESWIPDV